MAAEIVGHSERLFPTEAPLALQPVSRLQLRDRRPVAMREIDQLLSTHAGNRAIARLHPPAATRHGQVLQGATRQVLGADMVEIGFQAQDREHLQQRRDADRRVAAFEPMERVARDAGPLRHLDQAHPPPHPGELDTPAQVIEATLDRGRYRASHLRHVSDILDRTRCGVNLAVALAQAGASVGLLDADITGPNIPLMMGVEGQPKASANNKITPLERYGVKVISIQFFVPEGQPVVWRGPLVGGAIQQFLRDVEWGDRRHGPPGR